MRVRVFWIGGYSYAQNKEDQENARKEPCREVKILRANQRKTRKCAYGTMMVGTIPTRKPVKIKKMRVRNRAGR